MVEFGRSVLRREMLALLVAAPLTGCALGRRSNFYNTILGGGDERTPKVPITRAEADRVPYASMLVWLGDGQRAFVVLGEIAADRRLTWFTAKREPITTFGPFITKLLGPEVELRAVRFGGGWDSDIRKITSKDVLRDVDLSRRHQGNASVRTRSTFRAAGVETLSILEREFRLRRFVETVKVDPQTWFENEYWIEEDSGVCYKSRQSVLPTLPPVNIEILKQPRLS